MPCDTTFLSAASLPRLIQVQFGAVVRSTQPTSVHSLVEEVAGSHMPNGDSKDLFIDCI